MNEDTQRRAAFSVPAVSSLYVGIVGFCLVVAMPIIRPAWEPALVGTVAVLLGMVGLIRTWRNPIRRKDTYYAVCGIIVGVALVGMTLRGAFEPRLSPVSVCASNLKCIGVGIQIYARDHNGKFPPAETWNSTVMKCLSDNDLLDYRNPLYCPESDEPIPSYAMNKQLAGLGIEDVLDPSTTVLVFESVPGRNLLGGPALFPSLARHDSDVPCQVVLFCDGHTKMVEEKDLGKLNWDPRKKGKPLD